MLMYEVASAADTLALWKLISDNVWAAVQKMQKDEEQRKAAAQRLSTSKRGRRKPRAVAPADTFTPVPIPGAKTSAAAATASTAQTTASTPPSDAATADAPRKGAGYGVPADDV